MNKRIELIASYINQEDKVSDIGCDQAILSELLARKGIKSVASDIRENIIESAKIRIHKIGLSDFVSFVVSDGVKNIPDYINTIVLSGMGAHTILEIIKSATKTYDKIITISNNDHEYLRMNMLNYGYKIFLEEIIFDMGKYYNLIIFIPGIEDYSKEELLIGVCHKNLDLLNKKINLELEKQKIIFSLSKQQNDGIKIDILENYIRKRI